MKFIFSCSISISHEWAQRTSEISSWTLEDKFHISARPCIILYINYVLDVYLIIIPRADVGYELAIIISYPTSASHSEVTVLSKTTKNMDKYANFIL